MNSEEEDNFTFFNVKVGLSRAKFLLIPCSLTNRGTPGHKKVYLSKNSAPAPERFDPYQVGSRVILTAILTYMWFLKKNNCSLCPKLFFYPSKCIILHLKNTYLLIYDASIYQSCNITSTLGNVPDSKELWLSSWWCWLHQDFID